MVFSFEASFFFTKYQRAQIYGEVNESIAEAEINAGGRSIAAPLATFRPSFPSHYFPACSRLSSFQSVFTFLLHLFPLSFHNLLQRTINVCGTNLDI